MHSTLKTVALFLILATACNAQPFWKSKAWWAGEAVIAGMAAMQGAAASRVKQGGTYIFGNNTSNAKIIGFELGANLTAFSAENTAAWHFSHDDPSPAWRTFGKIVVPGEDAFIGLWIETHTNWGHKAGKF